MIKGFGGERLTPKQKAQELIYDQLVVLRHGYWVEMAEDLTDREIELVSDQLEKISNRIAKLLGFESV